MRLVGQIHVTIHGEIVKRGTSFWDRVKSAFGGRVNLETGELQNQLEATAVVDAVRRALGRLGVDNALALVIDRTVIYQDDDGKAADLPDLVLALSEHASVFGRAFHELRFAVEHEEAGVHMAIEIRARTRHRRDEPAAVVSIGGRIRALEPARGETAETYRARVEPLTRDAALFESSRLAFDSFVARLQQALAAAMPEANVVEKKTEARLVKRGAETPAAPEQSPREPMHPAYDPFLIYYPSPMGWVLDALIVTSFVNMMMPPPMLLVTPMGMPIDDGGPGDHGGGGGDDTMGDQDVHQRITSDHDTSDYQDASVWDDGGGDGGGDGDI